MGTVEGGIALEKTSVLPPYFQSLQVVVLKGVRFLIIAIFNFKYNLGNGSFRKKKIETSALLSFLFQSAKIQY